MKVGLPYTSSPCAANAKLLRFAFGEWCDAGKAKCLKLQRPNHGNPTPSRSFATCVPAKYRALQCSHVLVLIMWMCRSIYIRICLPRAIPSMHSMNLEANTPKHCPPDAHKTQDSLAQGYTPPISPFMRDGNYLKVALLYELHVRGCRQVIWKWFPCALSLCAGAFVAQPGEARQLPRKTDTLCSKSCCH